jgi:two-component system, LuxR family, sensor kinase FixL
MGVGAEYEGDAELERQALDQAPLMIRTFDGTIRFWAEGMQRLYGYDAREAFGRVSHELLNTAFPQPLAEIQAEILDRGQWHGELVHRRRDSELVVVASQWSILPNGNNESPAVTEVNVRRNVARDGLGDEDRQRLISIIESSQDAIVGKTLDGIVTSWNRAAQDMFGYAAEDILGQPISLLFPPDRINEESEILERLRRGERIAAYEAVRRRRDGEEIIVSLSVSPIRNAAGQVVGASKIARDITQQKRTVERLEQVRAELLHVSRLSAMGQMAASLAHELNQPLTAVRNYLSAMRRMVGATRPDPERIGDIAARADAQAARAGEVIRHLRDFVTKGETAQVFDDINKVVEEVASLASVDLKQRGVTISLRLAPFLPLVRMDRVQIQQVVLNLLRNAAEAMAEMEPRELIVTTARRGDCNAVAVSVADTGPGIAPDIAARLFQPFVSSKKTGMGLGLSICRDIVEAHGGTLAAAANLPRGTTFSLLLPVTGSSQAERR